MRTLIFFAFLLLCCNSQDNTKIYEKRKVEFNFSQYSYDDIKAIYFIDKIDRLNLKIFDESFSALNIDYEIKNYLEKDNFINKFNNLKENEKREVLIKARKWNSIKSSIEFIIENSENPDYMEFFYNYPKTSKLFAHYIKTSNQDWGSLTSSDQSEVYYLIINEIYSYNKNTRLQILKDFCEFMN